MKQIFLLIFTAVFSATSFSQTGSVSGKVTDSSGKKIMPLATVTVFRAKDTSIVTYRLSNENGDFKIPGLPLDIPLRLMVTYSGYEAYRKAFILSPANNTMHFDSVMLVSTSKQLDEVMVFAERPPVIIKKDTIEFNASAFKTLPNALVEDLLRKLPGVQVDKEGNINVNGKAVNRILVDGKTFFGDDPKMATRNLPANAIDKVQVVDDKEELLRNGDDNINNVGKVINITLKKGVKKGWFGKMYAGAGTDKLYEAGAIANIYRDTLQFSVLGYVNNLNRPGFSFSELLQTGGMDRNSSLTGSRSMSIWTNPGGSSISINGINFGGSQNYGGIATSRGIGFNMNHAPNTKRSFFVQYFFGDVDIDRRTVTTTDQYNADTVFNNRTVLTGDVATQGHNFGTGVRLKPDSVTNILLNVNYMIGLSDEDRISDVHSTHNKLGPLSFGDINQDNKSQIYNYRHNFSITRLSKIKAGRRFTITHALDINNRFNDNTTESGIRFLYPNQHDSMAAQLRNERVPRTDASGAFNYSEPLNKTITIRIGGRYEYSHLKNDINTFKRNTSTFKYDVPNLSLSSNFERESNRFLLTPGIEFKIKKFTITPQVRAAYQHIDNDFESLAAPVEQKLSNILPALSVVYKQLNFNYSRDISLPSYTYFLPVKDNTNPYFITKGNTNLLPPERDNISLNYYFNDPKTNFNASIYLNGGFTNHDIIQSITVDEKGIQTSMPVNADGSSNFYWNFNLYKQYKNNQKFIWSWNVGGNYNYNRSRFLYNENSSWQTGFNINTRAGLNLNWNDKVEFNISYSPGQNFTKYTNPTFQKLKINYRYWENELIIRWPKHVIWETQSAYTYNSSIPAGNPKGVTLWNAAVNFTMLKDETGVLKFSVFDILKKGQSIFSYANRNMITTTQQNILGQYFLATFTYNVRAAGVKKKIGGRERFFYF